jgi:hypothetical protein
LVSIQKAVFDTYIFYLLIRNLRFFVGKYVLRNGLHKTLCLWRLFIAFTIFCEILTSLAVVLMRVMAIPSLVPIRNMDGFLFGEKFALSLFMPWTNFLESLSIVFLVFYLCKE